MSDFASERSVTARKAHHCGECGRTIDPGETYQRAAGCWWGDFWHQRTCSHCAALRPMLREIDPDYYEDYYGGLSEHLYESRDQIPVSLLRALVNMQRRWRRRDGSLVDVPGGAS